MKKIYNFISKYKKEIIVIFILIIICICIYYFNTKNNYEGFFNTSTTEPSTTQPPIDCIGKYENVGVCMPDNQICGPGKQMKEYVIKTNAENGGTECNIEAGNKQTVVCNDNPCPIECSGKWSEWSECDKDCNGGKQTRKFVIETNEEHGGTCELRDAEETRECNTDPCGIECDGAFEKLGECSRKCGGGVLRQFYDITTEAQHGGGECEHNQNDLKTIPCNTQPCPTYSENITIKESLKESNDKIQNIRYDIINRQEELDLLTNKFNKLNKNISFIKNNTNYIPDDKTLKFY